MGLFMAPPLGLGFCMEFGACRRFADNRISADNRPSAGYVRRYENLAEKFSKTGMVFDPVAEGLVELDNPRVGGAHLEIDLRAPV